MNTARATGTIAVLRSFEAKGEGAEVRDLAKKFNGSLGVAAFEFAIGGAHAAKGLQLAGGADGLAHAGRLANVLEPAIPALPEAAIAEIGAVLMREDADGHPALGIDGTTVLTTTASIFFRALLEDAAG